MAVEEAASLREQMSRARSRIREMREMLMAANSLDQAADDGTAAIPIDRSELAPYLLALALDMCATQVPAERGAAELLEVAHGSPMALLSARALASNLHKELPHDARSRLVVDLLTLAVRRARVEAFGTS